MVKYHARPSASYRYEHYDPRLLNAQNSRCPRRGSAAVLTGPTRLAHQAGRGRIWRYAGLVADSSLRHGG